MLSSREIEHALTREREQLLRRFRRALEVPMLVLAFVWLALFVYEMAYGLGPQGRLLGYVIWAIFSLDFLVAFVIAPQKSVYLRQNWLTAIALLAPALRIARIARVLRLTRVSRVAAATRSARVLRAVSSINRGMRALGKSMRRRGLGYVSLLTLIVAFAGAAGMLGLEPAASVPRGFETYGDAFWWTVMILTSIGPEYWPQTPAGRVLCFLLALYALGVLGYIAATLATFFIGRDAENASAELPGARDLAALHAELRALRAQLTRMDAQRTLDDREPTPQSDPVKRRSDDGP